MKKKNRRPSGFFTAMDNSKLLKYTFELHEEGITKGKIRKKDLGLYNILQRRRLIHKFPSELGPRRCFTKMDDRVLLRYTFSLYGKNITRGEIDKKDHSLYNLLRERGLLYKFQLKIRAKEYLESLSDKKLLNYTYSLHGEDITRGELAKKDQCLYNQLRKRGFLDKFPSKRRPRGFFASMNNKELLEYTFSLHGRDITRGELRNKDDGLYSTLGKRGLIKKISLSKNRIKDGYYKDFNQVKADLWKWIEEHNGEFPTQNRLRESKGGSLGWSIQRYYGGLYAVRERIGYNEIKRIELAKELEKIVEEL